MIILEENDEYFMADREKEQLTSEIVFKIRVRTSRRLTRPFSNTSNFDRTSSI